MPEPLLHFGDVGLMVERICRRRRPERMVTDLESEGRRIRPDDLVDRIRRDCPFQSPSSVVADRPKQRPVLVFTM
jgi:hypothetical protein